MKRKRVFAAFLIILVIIMQSTMLCFSGCRAETRKNLRGGEYPDESSGRFVIIDGDLWNFSTYCKVVKDTQTGVLYLFVKSGYGGGLSVIYNADGTVMTSDSVSRYAERIDE